MKALIYTAPENLTYGDFEDPTPKANEELIRVDSVGICGSDMHAYLGHDERRPAPLILGHEVSGVIASGKNKGKRVAINPLVTCGSCAYCQTEQENLCPARQIISMKPRQGAFAEMLAMPPENLIEVPDDISLESAALIEPIACGWHAVNLAIKHTLAIGDTPRCLVIGGGAVGFGAALSLKAMKINEITLAEPSQLRRDYLAEKTQIEFVDSRKLSPQNSAYKDFDIVIDAAGFEATRELASNLVRPGGVIAHIGLGSNLGGLNIRRMTLQEIKFIGTYTYSKQDFKAAANALFTGKIECSDWSEIRPLKQGHSAFHDIKNGKIRAPKVILKPF